MSHGQDEINRFMAMVNDSSSDHDVIQHKDMDEKYGGSINQSDRTDEINRFVAMANGDYDPGTGKQEKVYHTERQRDIDRNLDAALASLEEQPSQPRTIFQPLSANTPKQTSYRRKPKIDQIYSEYIRAPRPLFFGDVLPLRVKKVIDSIPTLQSPYVTLYEPVWGDRSRLRREDRIFQTDEVSIQEKEAIIDETDTNSCNLSSESSSSTSNSVECDVENHMCGNLFSQYARGESENNTFRPVDSLSSYGSFEGSELKKQVGLNDNLSKALESLADVDVDGGSGAVSFTAADAGAAAAKAAEVLMMAVKDGRPLSNLELTGGRVPLYGCDDESLPRGADLGNYETKEDQAQSFQEYESQEIIGSTSVPSIFGPTMCPISSNVSDNNHYWFNRGVIKDQSVGAQKESRLGWWSICDGVKGHEASTTLECLPYLSDRSPSTRYIQIDAQYVGFPLESEIEPLFCSLSIWHVEQPTNSLSKSNESKTSINMERCSRITEALHFDIISDSKLEQKYMSSIWPFLKEGDDDDSVNKLQGTRCGVFPLPSNLEMSSLHAVLIVQKVVDEKLLAPFAFGAAPLLQVIGDDSPKIPSSHAVQIPLFRIEQGQGEKSIIEHILVMMCPRDDGLLSGIKPAKLSDGGTAMLVMRNFGYLGIHSAIHSQSKLARDRLVDFTGDLQVRRRRPEDIVDESSTNDDEGHIHIVPHWNNDFICEPSLNGGRNTASMKRLSTYAQEVAPVPLLTKQDRTESLFRMSFCNELLCQPRLLHNCIKRKITIKIEIREVRFCDEIKSLVATLPVSGPTIHNNRRGPYLIYDFLTAIYEIDTSSQQFFDEVKVKLPLTLCDEKDGKNLCIFFSVYSVNQMDKNRLPERINLEILGCGFLPLFPSENGTPYLINDELHDVKLNYVSKPASQERSVHQQDGTKQFEFNSLNSLILHPLIPIEEIDEVHSTLHSRESSIIATSESTRRDTNIVMDHKKESMVLQVRTVAFSSIHPKNKSLAKFFSSVPSVPRCLEPYEFQSDWQISKDLSCQYDDRENVTKNDHEAILTQNTIDISTLSQCPASEMSSHFERIIFQLWRTMVTGSGEPSIHWANPAALIPLRLHSFSALLYVISNVNSFVARSGMEQLNGKEKWNLRVMSQIVTLLFDEAKLFLDSSTTQIESIADILSDLRRSDMTDDLKIHKEHCASFCHDEPMSRANGSINTSKDDLNLLSLGRKPVTMKVRCNSLPNTKGIKIDTKSEFQSKLNAGTSPTNNINGLNGPAANRRKWMADSSSSLATIQEDNDKIDENPDENTSRSKSSPTKSLELIDENQTSKCPIDPLDTELILHKSKPTKQMRVPKVQNIMSESSNLDENIVAVSKDTVPKKENEVEEVKTVPKSDIEIETAGSQFLDMISKNFSFGTVPKGMCGEEKRVGSSHHRKTKSRCSIDWTLPPTDLFIENQRQHEMLNETSDSHIDDGLSTDRDVSAKNSTIALQSKSNDSLPSRTDHPFSKDVGSEDDAAYPLVLPSFSDRINLMRKSSNVNYRWFPYTYEVIIFSWNAILREQTKKCERGIRTPQSSSNDLRTSESCTNQRTKCLNDAAKKARGISISCAPILFDIIKKSIGFRYVTIFLFLR